MEKRVAQYSLDVVKDLIKEENYIVTGSARIDYTALGFTDEDVTEIVLSLVPQDLYKSMTTYHDNIMWQDVYAKRINKINLYIKLQVTTKAIIISFKERT